MKSRCTILLCFGTGNVSDKQAIKGSLKVKSGITQVVFEIVYKNQIQFTVLSLKLSGLGMKPQDVSTDSDREKFNKNRRLRKTIRDSMLIL
jgi:hypothetical protein